MKKHDLVWLAVLAAITCFIVVPATHQLFISATKAHPYIMGFVKFGIMATMGELLAIRLISGNYKKPLGLIYRAIIWGLIGILVTLMFQVFSSGVTGAMANHMLFTSQNETFNKFLQAFSISVIMNLFFAPSFMTAHRITDTYIDLGKGKFSSITKVPLKSVINTIDWNSYFSFVILKTIPFFWIPAHTINFLLPPEYRVLVAAFYSIILGALLAYGKRTAKKS